MPSYISSFIPKKRGTSAQIITLIVSCVLLLAGWILVIENRSAYILLGVSFSVTVITITEVIYRMCLLYEESKHLSTRYENNSTELFLNSFTFSKKFLLVSSISTICSVSFFYQNKNAIGILFAFGPYSNILMLCAVLLSSKVIDLDHGPLYQALNLEKLGGLDFGASMAHSFFHGYLKIVLPRDGTEQKGIKELMKDFESNEQITFEYDRLLILIPMSLYCPPNLEDHSKIIELAQSLPEIRVSRGGVHARIYKSTAYKIRTTAKEGPTKRVYVCAEYATPLRTLYDIIHNNNEHARVYQKYKNELVVQFYLTLRDILDKSPDCKNCCDLILFKDMTDDNEFEDVGNVLLNHLKHVNAIR